MASGWAPEGAVQDQIEASIEDAVAKARSRLTVRQGIVTHCEHCGGAIPKARREAVPGVRLYIGCQSSLEATEKQVGGINRRASKDSQLR